MPLTDAGIYYADTSTNMSIADITAAMATSMGSALTILQVASTTKLDSFTTTSTAYTDITGLSVSITPKFATSKILVMSTVSFSHVTANESMVQLVRNGVVIGNGTFGTTANGFAQASSSYSNGIFNQNITHLDSPATTGVVTYKIQGRIVTGGTMAVNRRGTDGAFGTSSSITVLEVAG